MGQRSVHNTDKDGRQREKALITGISGQDGSYLAELLLAKGYEVHGIIRRSSSLNTARIDGIYQDPHVPEARLRLVYGDLNDASSLNRILRTIQPDEIYNLGAQSHVRVSFDVPEYTAEVNFEGEVVCKVGEPNGEPGDCLRVNRAKLLMAFKATPNHASSIIHEGL